MTRPKITGANVGGPHLVANSEALHRHHCSVLPSGTKVFAKHHHAIMTTILASPVRVVDRLLACLQLLERHLQGLLTANRLQTVPTVISHHMTRYLVGQQRQKHEAFFRARHSFGISGSSDQNAWNELS